MEKGKGYVLLGHGRLNAPTTHIPFLFPFISSDKSFTSLKF
jgi:hypothetical protein